MWPSCPQVALSADDDQSESDGSDDSDDSDGSQGDDQSESDGSDNSQGDDQSESDGSDDSQGDDERYKVVGESSTSATRVPSKRKRSVGHNTANANGLPPRATNTHDSPVPIITGNPRLDRAQHLRDMKLERHPPWMKLMEKEDRDADNEPQKYWHRQLQLHEDMMEDSTEVPPQVPLQEVSAPGYGILPNNASFMHDVTRVPPKNGYGLGERDQGGLWLMDKSPSELFCDDGYITVSDTEDEEEEERGWKRQMKADLRMEQGD